MAELQEQMTETPVPANEDVQIEAATPLPDFEDATHPAGPPAGLQQKKKKRNRKKVIRGVIALAVVAGLGTGGVFLWKKLHAGTGEDEGEILTDFVTRGEIVSKVEGSGAAVAKDSATITVRTGGKVREVFVSEGDEVEKGAQLYVIDSKEAQDRVTQMREALQNATKSLENQERGIRSSEEKLQKLLDEPTEADVTADFSGIVIDVAKLEPGKKVTKDTDKIAVLVDNTRLLLPLYFSYTYENDIYVGQSATISVPATMSQLTGEVHEIHKVERISPEGGRLFEVVFVVNNPGGLTAEMAASATVEKDGETIYPYEGDEAGKLAYFRTKELLATLTGEITTEPLYDYSRVSAGQSVAHIAVDTEERDEQIKTQREQIEDAQRGLDSYRKSIEEAQTNLDNAIKAVEELTAYAPISGTVLSLGIQTGSDVTSGTTAVSIADTSTMLINATVDEMKVAYAKPGMPVEISTGWEDGMQLTGVIDSVSLTAKSENGIASFPMTISVDNSDGSLLTGAYVNYSFTASQNPDCLLAQVQSVKSVETENGTQKVVFVRADVPPEEAIEPLSGMEDIPEGFWPIPVEIGISDNNNVEIVSGVEEGTEIFSSRMRSDQW